MGIFRRQRTEASAPTGARLVGRVSTDPVAGSDGTLDGSVDGSAAASTSHLQWGLPSRCPQCGGYGYLDRIDLVREVMHQHCPTCWHRWQLSKAEVDAASS